MEKESLYVNQLRNLALQIQTKIGNLDSKTEEQLVEASKWKCHDKTEKKLLTELINRAQEIIELERIVKEHKGAIEAFEKYIEEKRWFNSISMLLQTFDVPLRKLSFSDLSLIE
jgi:hypothetical protein